MALYAINRQIPESGTTHFRTPVTLADVLAQTQVKVAAAPAHLITMPGEHDIHLATRLGDLTCRVTVRRTAESSAPLLLYHHGLAEHPYTSSWGRLLPKREFFPAHTVAIQAPYHSNMSDPLRIGFSSTEHLYQMFAGSLRIMAHVQEQFEGEGTPFTVAGGVSWGGITSLLYEGFFGSTRATIPFFASPKLSQAIWDIAELFGRELPVSRDDLDALFDFTPIYERIDQRQVFPVMGEHDLFFRLDNHKGVYEEGSLLTLPVAHVGAMWFSNGALREHLLKVLTWAAEQTP